MDRDERDKWTETLLEFYEREGYYPDFGKPESWRGKEERASEYEQPTRPRLVLRKRRYWK